MAIEYVPTERGFKVKLSGRFIGEVKQVPFGSGSGWQYFPKGQKNGGAIFATWQLCKASLEQK